MARIYVSSTFSDLRAHREKAYRVLRQLGHDVVAMEHYVAADERPLAKCLADVASCDLYIGIFAHRYGYIPEQDNPDERSITELEYRHAGDRGVPRLVFLVDEETAWSPKQMDAVTGEGERGARIVALREELGRDRLASFFTDADDLAQKVSVATSKHLAAEAGDAAASKRAPALDLASYFRRLEQQYARLDLNALTPPQREEYLQILLRSVFVEQQVRAEPPPVELPKMTWELLRAKGELRGEDRGADLGLAELHQARDVYQRKPARPVLDVLTERGSRLVTLLGDPGAGKSTLARYLILALVEGTTDARLEGTFGQHLPLLIELRSYAGLRAQGKCDTFLGFLGYLGRTEGYGLTEEGLDRYLREGGRALVIFDGLDELFDPAERETVSRQIAGFAGQYEHVRVVVTSRIIGYRREILDGAGFRHYTLQDLERAQVECFIRSWYELAFHQQPEEAESRCRRLAHAVDESPSIRELAGNPLLLTILAIIGKHQDLPRERWKLYDHAAGVLVEHWDVNKHLADARVDADFIGEEDKKELLRRVALRMQSGRGGLAGNYLPDEDLQDEFENYLATRYRRDPAAAKVIAKTMIHQFRERNFVLSTYGAGLYGFVHRAFLEYFCAAAFVRRFEKSQELTLEQLKSDVFGAHWEDEAWHEVLRLICGMLDERFTAELLDFLIDVYQPWPARLSKCPPRNLFLATNCLAEVRNLAAVRPQADRLLRTLTALIDHLMHHQDSAAAMMLEKSLLPAVALVGPRWPGREIFRTWFQAKGLRMGWILGTPTAGRLLGALFVDSEEVRQELHALATKGHSGAWRRTGLAGLVQGWPNHPTTLPLVSRSVTHDADLTIRELAVELLSDQWGGSPETLTLLRERIRMEPDESLSIAIARVIGEAWPNDDLTFGVLRARSQGFDVWHRDDYLEALAVGWPDHQGTLPLLLDTVGNLDRFVGYRKAVHALAVGWPDHPEILPLLLELARAEIGSVTRGDTLKALADGWPDHPQTLPLLLDAARDENGDYARSDALEALADGWPDHPETLPLLLAAARDDTDDYTRSEVLQFLADGWPDHPQTLPLLLDGAHDEDGNYTRGDALKALADGWPDHPQTLSLLLATARDETSDYNWRAALSAVVSGWPDHPETLPLLLELARDEPGSHPGGEALRALASGWPDHPETLPLVLGTARSADRDASISALRTLASGWPDHPETLPLLLAAARNTTDDLIRGEALRALASGWPDHPELLSLLLDAARDIKPERNTAGFDAMKALAVLSPTPEIGPVAREFVSEQQGGSQLRWLLEVTWPDEAAKLPDGGSGAMGRGRSRRR